MVFSGLFHHQIQKRLPAMGAVFIYRYLLQSTLFQAHAKLNEFKPVGIVTLIPIN